MECTLSVIYAKGELSLRKTWFYIARSVTLTFRERVRMSKYLVLANVRVFDRGQHNLIS